MIRLSMAFAVTLTWIGSALAASPDPKDLEIPPAELSRARELVQKLGSDDFQDREAAQAELARMGRLARPALAVAVSSDPNPEIRSRAARLLPRAEAQELKARIDTFLADTELAYDHQLPGWDEFRQAVRSEQRLFGVIVSRDREKDKAARRVYIEMLENDINRAVLTAIGGPPSDLGILVANRKTELYNSRFPRGGVGQPAAPRREITAIDVLTVMFAESQVESRFIPSSRITSMSVLVSTSGFNAAAQTPGETGEIYRAIATRWLDTRDEPNAMNQALSISSTLNLPEPGKRLAARLLDSGGGLATYRAQAVVTLVRFDGREHLPTLERLLTDRTPTTTNRVVVNGVVQQQNDIEMRDLALAALVLLTDQKPEDYGLMSRYANSNTRYISYQQYYFPADSPLMYFALRSAAFAKWAQWRANSL